MNDRELAEAKASDLLLILNAMTTNQDLKCEVICRRKHSLVDQIMEDENSDDEEDFRFQRG